ncbi:MAG: hypothetical protein JNJ46_34920 [Myxococcales bacterium]|nr:hypothetical protein [Myxococcales bacterium]
MQGSNSALTGAMSGLLIAAATSWARQDDDTQRRLRNIRIDAETALDEIRNLQGRGDMIRLRLPSVQDFQVGLALANPAAPSTAVTPPVGQVLRPNLRQMAQKAEDLQWPPRVGVYESNGMTSQPGDLTFLSLAFCFEEVRAFVLGLAQPAIPFSDTKTQIFNAASGLVQALNKVGTSLKLTEEDYATIWYSLFSGGAGTGSGNDPHNSTALAPTATSGHASVALTPLGLPELGAYPYYHQNTDRAFKFRAVVTGTTPSGTTFATFKFGTQFNRDGKPFQPAVACSDGRVKITSLLPGQFSVENLQQFQNENVDLAFSVTGG